VDARIEALDADGARACRPGLTHLLVDAVNGGASVGFLPPLDAAEAGAYWESVARAVREGSRVLLVARGPGHDGLVGTAQLGLETRPNGRHRAEVMKVLVLSAARRQGIGRALMDALEEQARQHGRTTLVLDTRAGDPSERLYRACGWTAAGVIPGYARNGEGGLDPTVVYYRLLDAGTAGAGGEARR
jgi:acetyltransferase